VSVAATELVLADSSARAAVWIKAAREIIPAMCGKVFTVNFMAVKIADAKKFRCRTFAIY
jgi:hypothetical protein